MSGALLHHVTVESRRYFYLPFIVCVLDLVRALKSARIAANESCICDLVKHVKTNFIVLLLVVKIAVVSHALKVGLNVNSDVTSFQPAHNQPKYQQLQGE